MTSGLFISSDVFSLDLEANELKRQAISYPPSQNKAVQQRQNNQNKKYHLEKLGSMAN